MALLGGGVGGAGNPVGGSFTGPAKTLELVGDHIYAYSGIVGVTDDETSMIEATSGNYYAVCKIQFLSNMASGNDYVAKVYLNNAIIIEFIQSATHDAAPYGYYPIHLIVPSYSELKVTLANVTNTNSNNWDF